MDGDNRVEITTTTKGKEAAIHDGFMYRIHRKNKDGSISWLCLKEKLKEGCRGRLKTRNGLVIEVAKHKCIPDLAECEVKKSIAVAKQKMTDENSTASSVYKDHIAPLYDNGLDFVTNLPSYQTAKNTLNKIKRKACGITKEPQSAEDITITEDTLKMKNGESFLICDERDGDRIMLFASNKCLKVLAEGKSFFLDGTFKSCPTQFKQLYTIHVDIGSTRTEISTIPLLFALLPNKKKETYTRMFKHLKSRFPEWKPIEIVMDFEASAISSIRELFPTTSIKGCNYHFNQCLWRNVQDIGLVSAYTSDGEIRMHVRMCAALAHLPVEDVENGWLKIMENSPSGKKIEEFNDYFVTQWMENGNIDIEMWNCFGRRHRTNNAVEGWHHRLNSMLRPNPKFMDAVTCFIKEAENSDALYDRSYLNFPAKKRRRRYVDMDDRIEKTLCTLAEDKDIHKCLKILAHIQKLE